jgi:predicted TPR repeat methyltransferase
MTGSKGRCPKWYNTYAKDKEVTDDQIVSVPSARYKHILVNIEQLISLMSFSDADRVLDAGCGAGRFIYGIRKRVASYLELTPLTI